MYDTDNNTTTNSTAAAGMMHMSSSRIDATTMDSKNYILLPPDPDPTVQSFLTEHSIPAEAYRYNSTTGSSGSGTTRCPPTSQLKAFLREDGRHWILQSLDLQGNPKTVGGDEFTILYMDHNDMNTQEGQNQKSTIPRSIYETPTAVALVEDLQNGLYRLDFVSSPLSGYKPEARNWQQGTFYVHLHYTCGMGRLTAPHKDSWGQPGMLNRRYYHANVTAPPIRLYQPPPMIDFAQFDAVFCLGDSLVRNLCGSYLKEGTRTDAFSKPNLKLVTNVGEYLCNSSLVPRAIDELETTYGQELGNTSQKTAVLVGSYAWDALANYEPPGHGFERTLERNKRIVELSRQRYPHATVILKGPSAVNPYILDFEECLVRMPACRRRVGYMSNSITRNVHGKQKQLMAELKVPYLDLYETSALSPSWSLDKDGVHYRKWLNIFMNNLLYPKEMQIQL